MFASFHSKGTTPSCSDMLNMCASGVLIYSTLSFSILGDIPSTPLTRFNKIAIQGAPQMAVDKEAISLSRIYSYYSKCYLFLFYV